MAALGEALERAREALERPGDQHRHSAVPRACYRRSGSAV